MQIRLNGDDKLCSGCVDVELTDNGYYLAKARIGIASHQFVGRLHLVELLDDENVVGMLRFPDNDIFEMRPGDSLSVTFSLEAIRLMAQK